MAELDNIIEEPSDSQKRITQLSGKVKEESEAKDAAIKAKDEAEAKAVESARNAEFSEGFVEIMAENPAAKEFKEDIKSKVMSGMSLEDAKFAVLGKAGMLNTPRVEVQTTTAGGSASTVLPQEQGTKTPGEMTQAERRAELMQREGELQGILAPRINS